MFCFLFCFCFHFFFCVLWLFFKIYLRLIVSFFFFTFICVLCACVFCFCLFGFFFAVVFFLTFICIYSDTDFRLVRCSNYCLKFVWYLFDTYKKWHYYNQTTKITYLVLFFFPTFPPLFFYTNCHDYWFSCITCRTSYHRRLVQ